MSFAYDKGKYHDPSIEELGLPEEHAVNHTISFVRWLIEGAMLSDWWMKEVGEDIGKYRAGELSLHELYESWDRCLISDMLSKEGNAFASAYFDFEKGQYIHDYIALLQGDLPTELHVKYSEDVYQKLKPVIDERYKSWRTSSACAQ